jgi:hypothetical protein
VSPTYIHLPFSEEAVQDMSAMTKTYITSRACDILVSCMQTQDQIAAFVLGVRYNLYRYGNYLCEVLFCIGKVVDPVTQH